MPAKKPKLNPRQQKFVNGLFEGKSLSGAYQAAGYKARAGASLYTAASQLFRNVKVLEAIAEREEAHRATLGARFWSMTDGASNIYIRIMNMNAGENEKILEIQRKVAQDMFDRVAAKPEQPVKVSGKVEHDSKVGLQVEGLSEDERDAFLKSLANIAAEKE